VSHTLVGEVQQLTEPCEYPESLAVITSAAGGRPPSTSPTLESDMTTSSSSPATPNAEDAPQVRGVSTVGADPRFVGRVIASLGLLVLLGVAVATTVSAANQNSNLDTLRQHGVPVQATVTGCEGIGSGIGMGIEYYDCRATYTLDGHTYNEVIRGSRNLLQVGQVESAVAVPGRPALLSASNTVEKKSSAWAPYVTPIILWVIVVLGALGLLLWWRRPGRGDSSPRRPGSTVPGTVGRRPSAP
jgi:hypothetical protein